MFATIRLCEDCELISLASIFTLSLCVITTCGVAICVEIGSDGSLIGLDNSGYGGANQGVYSMGESIHVRVDADGIYSTACGEGCVRTLGLVRWAFGAFIVFAVASSGQAPNAPHRLTYGLMARPSVSSFVAATGLFRWLSLIGSVLNRKRSTLCSFR